jgi:hypothetical protein
VAERQRVVDPAAPRPPFGFRLQLPDDWEPLDLDPWTSAGSIERCLDRWVAARLELGADRARLRKALAEVVAASRRDGVFLVTVLASVRGWPEEPLGASLSLAWRRLDMAKGIPVDGVVQALATAPPDPDERRNDRTLTRVELTPGPAACLRTLQSAQVPGGGSRRLVALTQFLVPIGDQPWLAAITAATPNLDLADDIAAIAHDVASSLEVTAHPDVSSRGALLGRTRRRLIAEQPHIASNVRGREAAALLSPP